jgi:hypothetical protein
MARDGSGTYTNPYPDFVAGTTISSTQVDANNSDIAAALTASLAKDGQTVPTANLPMGTYRHTGVGNSAARTDYAATGQAQDGSFTWGGTAGGTADALTLTLTPAITAYAAGQTFRFISSANANTGASTVAISGLAAKAIQSGGNALTAGQIGVSMVYEITYDGAAFQISDAKLGGTGDMLKSENLSGLANYTTARSNLGLGTAATLTAGTAANNAVQLNASAQLPAVSGALLTNLPNTEDQVARDIAVSAYIKADVAGSDVAGTYGRVFSDDFETDTLATKTNATWNAAKYYENPGTPSTSYANAGGTGDRTATITVTKSGASWNSTGSGSLFVDGNTANNNNVTMVTIGQAVSGIYARFDFGVAASKVINEVKIYCSTPLNEGDWKWQGSNDASAWTDIGSSFTLSGSNPSVTITSVSANVTGYRYYQMLGVSGTGTSTWMQEFDFKIADVASPGDMTLIPNATTLSVEPNDAAVYVLKQNIDSVSEGTDFKVWASIDGGTTFAEATLTTVGTFGADDKLIRGDADVSAQTGTSFKWKITTLNNKSQRIKQVTGYTS